MVTFVQGHTGSCSELGEGEFTDNPGEECPPDCVCWWEEDESADGLPKFARWNPQATVYLLKVFNRGVVYGRPNSGLEHSWLRPDAWQGAQMSAGRSDPQKYISTQLGPA